MVADPAEGMSSTVLPLVGDGIGNEICNAQMLEKSKAVRRMKLMRNKATNETLTYLWFNCSFTKCNGLVDTMQPCNKSFLRSILMNIPFLLFCPKFLFANDKNSNFSESTGSRALKRKALAY